MSAPMFVVEWGGQPRKVRSTCAAAAAARVAGVGQHTLTEYDCARGYRMFVGQPSNDGRTPLVGVRRATAEEAAA